MSPASVLIVDDDAELSILLTRLLRREGWQVQTALTAAQADLALGRAPPDVVLLDVMLPDASGLTLCRRWRQSHPRLGILMLTAARDPTDRVLALELGADDYQLKPFDERELLARLRALLRRQQAHVGSEPVTWQFGELSIHLISREVRAQGQRVSLSGTEFKLLVALARSPGLVVTRQQLSLAVQPSAYRPLDRTVDVQVGRLRRRLSQALPGSEWIETVRGEGYAFVPRVESPLLR